MNAWNTTDSSAYQAMPRCLFPFAPPTAVSTPAPLLTLAPLGAEHEDLVFTLRNHGASQCVFIVDRSESGVAIDADPQTVYVPAGGERRLELRDVLSLYWSLTASGDPDGGYPSVSVSWQLLVRRRR